MAHQHGRRTGRVWEGDALSLAREVQAYERHRNLKLAAAEVGMPWQTLYLHLKKAGVPVAGDRLRYGTDRDRLGALAEAEFGRLVPSAVACNDRRYQAPIDFDVRGYGVDVKCAMPRRGLARSQAQRWAFSFKRQSLTADFVCCFCMTEARAIDRVLLVPQEFFAGLQSISVACSGASKWLDYAVLPAQLAEFFAALPERVAAA